MENDDITTAVEVFSAVAALGIMIICWRYYRADRERLTIANAKKALEDLEWDRTRPEREREMHPDTRTTIPPTADPTYLDELARKKDDDGSSR